MIQRFVFSLALLMLVGIFSCFAHEPESSKERPKKSGRTKYPHTKANAAAEKALFSKIGNWVEETKNTIGETLAQGYEAISQTDNSPSNQKHNYYSEGPLPDDYEPEGLKDILPSQNDALNIQENKAQSPQNEPIEEYPTQTQQSIVHIEPVLDNKPVEQQEINIIPSKQTVKQEPTIQQPAESQKNKNIGSQSNTPQSFSPALRNELYDGTVWLLKKTYGGVRLGWQKSGEVAEWASDRFDEYREYLEKRQRELEEYAKQQKVTEENFKGMEKLAQEARVKLLDIPENYQDGPIKQEHKVSENFESKINQDAKIGDNNLTTLPCQDSSYETLAKCSDVQKQAQAQNILTNPELPASNTLPQIDIQRNQEQQNIEQKVIEQNVVVKTQEQEVRQEIEQNVVAVPLEIRQENILPELKKNNISDVQKQQQQEQKNILVFEEGEKIQKLELSEKPKDEILTSNQEKIDINIEKISTNIPKRDELFKLFGVSFDKKQLMFFGAGVTATIIICGVTYALYKNKDKLKPEKVGNYVKEHKFAISGVISAVCALVVIGRYAKQQGMTLQSIGNRITDFLSGTGSVYN